MIDWDTGTVLGYSAYLNGEPYNAWDDAVAMVSAPQPTARTQVTSGPLGLAAEVALWNYARNIVAEGTEIAGLLARAKKTGSMDDALAARSKQAGSATRLREFETAVRAALDAYTTSIEPSAMPTEPAADLQSLARDDLAQALADDSSGVTFQQVAVWDAGHVWVALSPWGQALLERSGWKADPIFDEIRSTWLAAHPDPTVTGAPKVQALLDKRFDTVTAAAGVVSSLSNSQYDAAGYIRTHR